MDFCFFGIGLAFYGPSTVVPGFLTTLGASATVIGFLSTLQRAGWLLPQLFAARYLADKPLKKPYILVPGGISRTLILLLAGIVFATGAKPARLAISLTLFVIGAFWIGDGLASLAWLDFLSKSIPPHRRGRLTGVGQLLSGIFSFAAGFGVEWMLSDRGPAFPNNYAALFLVGFAMLALSFVAILLGKETRGVTASSVPTWRDYLPQLGRVLKHDHHFRRYLVARQVFGLSSLATPFYITFALDKLALPEQVVGRYTSVGVVGGALAAVLFGWLNERHGTKRASQVSIVVTAAVPILALVIPKMVTAPQALAWSYGLVFLALQASTNCYMPTWTAFVLEWASDLDRPLYMGLTNTLNGLTAFVSTLGGLILQWTDGNYALLFGLTAIGTLLTLPLALRLPEPRLVEHTSVLTPLDIG